MEFARPAVLLLAVFVAPLAWQLLRRRPRGVVVPASGALVALTPSPRVRLARWLPLLRAIGVLLIVVALAGPRIGDANAIVPAQGIDIALSLDVSGSMSSTLPGGSQSRLDATKEVIRAFIKGRTDDRIGYVVFARDAIALSPPTLDYAALDRLVADTNTGMVADGTSIGVGISSALNMLRDSTAASRIVILLTDGQHNTPTISPLDAADLAAAIRIRVYTIGLVQNRNQPVQPDIDEDLMRSIASRTGGKYFVADSAASLAAVYEQIGSLEKSAVGREHFERFTELAPWFMLPAAAIVLLELALGATWLRRAPA
jgi:Ca-activated chloride channel family protein